MPRVALHVPSLERETDRLALPKKRIHTRVIWVDGTISFSVAQRTQKEKVYVWGHDERTKQGKLRYGHIRSIRLQVALGQKCVPKMEPWEMEPKTKTCGFLVIVF